MVRRLALAAALLALVAGRARADDRALVEVIRTWFDPHEDSWKGRKNLKKAFAAETAAGVDLLKDLDRLQRLLYAGRPFEPGFDDKAWQKREDVLAVDEEGPYRSVRSKRWNFTYVLPKDYPSAGALRKVDRPPPRPLVFALHEKQDVGDEKTHPGRNALARWWPKERFPEVYDHWLLLAPAAADARFVREDGTLRPDQTIQVYAEFWRRYHVDFDRVVLDGADPALTVAAAWPMHFAGIVLRGGKVDPDLVPNFASVPVFVFDETLEQQLEAGGHPDVTRGDDAELGVWLGQIAGECKRRTPHAFTWTVKTPPDQGQAYWVNLQPEPSAPARTLTVSVDRGANRITLRTRGIASMTLFLNDRIVDLDREIQVEINDNPPERHAVERDLDRTLDDEMVSIRKGVYLGWLYPVTLRVQGDVPPPSPEEVRAAEVARLRGLLAGRRDLLPTSERSNPVLVALALDRRHRETRGVAGLTETTPLLKLHGDPDFGETADWFVKDVMTPAYAGAGLEPDPDVVRRTAEIGSRNAWLAVGAVLLFVGAAAVVALRTRRAA